MPHPIRFGFTIGQHYNDWPMIVRKAHLAEELGIDAIWVFDHFMSMRDGIEGPTMEGWMLLAGLAAVTQRATLGTLVTGNTYRHPALLAKQLITLDHLSNGRAILGFGAGWNEDEHRRYGFYFPPVKERVDRFAEALHILNLMMTEHHTTFQGRYYQLDDAPSAPKPLQQPRIPLLIGAKGPRMLRLVAQHADVWDADLGPDDPAAANIPALVATLDQHCHDIGRDPATLRRSVWSRNALDTSAGAHRWVNTYKALGFSDFIFNIGLARDLDAIRAVATEALPGLR